jgi:hypothetical protein
MKFVLLLFASLFFAAPARAQETVVLAIEGWRQEERSGVTYYRCASSICAAGSTVSTKSQPHRTAISLADFETDHRRLGEQNAGQGRIRAVRIADPKERAIKGVRVVEISREVDWADSTTTFTIEARLIGADKSFSLVSDSPKREWTVNNYEGFLKRLVDIAGIQSR